MFRDEISVDELINPKSVICCDDETVPLGNSVVDPNPLLTADAEMKVSDMNEAVATDIDEVTSLVINEDVSVEVK